METLKTQFWPQRREAKPWPTTPFQAGHISKRLKKGYQEGKPAFPGIHTIIKILARSPECKDGFVKGEYEDDPDPPSRNGFVGDEPLSLEKYMHVRGQKPLKLVKKPSFKRNRWDFSIGRNPCF